MYYRIWIRIDEPIPISCPLNYYPDAALDLDSDVVVGFSDFMLFASSLGKSTG